MLIENASISDKIRLSNKISFMAKELLNSGNISEEDAYKFRLSVVRMTAQAFDNSPTISETNGINIEFDDNSRLITRFSDEDKIYSTFSNHPILIDNILFRNVETAYQYYKNHNDLIYLVKLLACNNPSQVRHLGNEVYNLSLNDLSSKNIKMYDILYSLVLCKFTQHRELKTILLNDDIRFINTSLPHGNDCKCKECLSIEFTNYLGKVIILVREEIKRLYNIII